MSSVGLLVLGFLLLVLTNAGSISEPWVPGQRVSQSKREDVNECLTKLNCGPYEECVNRSGSYRCECRLGFESSSFKDKIECYDEDECKEEDICGNISVCYNTIGSYYCQCKPGYKANSVNFTAAQGGQCRDINECVDNAVNCGPNATCLNSIGSYHCECISGFVASNGQKRFNTSQYVTCDDINECLMKPICGPNATCVNTPGSNHCECVSGFVSSTGQERFTANLDVTCDESGKSSEDVILFAPDVESIELRHFCMNIEHRSSNGLQQLDPTLLIFLPVILWIQIYI